MFRRKKKWQKDADASKPGRDESVSRPLDTSRQEIRLLTLRPGTGSDTVRGNLHHAALKSFLKPRYETISYVWGDATLQATIIINGRVMLVTQSAQRIFRRVRRHDRPRVVWIDAVCINQSDMEERASQVELMYDIYRNGQRKLIWLGEEDETTGEALINLNQVLQDMKRDKNSKKMETINSKAPPKSTTSDHGFRFQLQEDVIMDYFKSPWFSRVWVVQEAALARTNICYRGSHKTPLRDVLRAAAWIRYKGNYNSSELAADTGLWRAVGLYDLFERSIAHWHRRRTNTLGSLILSLAYFEATQPRDHVFGVMGLFRMACPQRSIPAYLKPNYQKPIAEVFANAMTFCLEEVQDLHLLVFARGFGAKGSIPDLPTRVIDFNHAPSHPIYRYSFKADNDVEFEPTNSMAGGRLAQWNQLSLSGFVVDIIIATSDIMDAHLFNTAHRPLELVYTFLRSISYTQDLSEGSCGVAMSLTAGQNSQSERWTNATECHELWTSYVSKLNDSSYQMPEDWCEDARAAESLAARTTIPVQYFHLAFYDASGNGRLLQTRQGH